MKTSECFFRFISIASCAYNAGGGRGAGRDRRPRHLRGRGARAARHAERGEPADPGARARGRPGRRTPRDAVRADRRRRGAGPARPADPAARRRGAGRAGASTAGRVEVTVAVNADSLATWFRDVLAEVGGRTTSRCGSSSRTRRYSAELLRSGEALAAVTSDPQPVQGCRSEHLGFLRYRPAATPGARRALAHGPRPRLAADAGGRLQRQGRPPARRAPRPRRHRARRRAPGARPAPTSTRRSGSASAGGCCPSPSCSPTSTSGRLVTLGGRTHHDVHLHWQRWRIDSVALRDADRRRPGRARGATSGGPAPDADPPEQFRRVGVMGVRCRLEGGLVEVHDRQVGGLGDGDARR